MYIKINNILLACKTYIKNSFLMIYVYLKYY